MMAGEVGIHSVGIFTAAGRAKEEERSVIQHITEFPPQEEAGEYI